MRGRQVGFERPGRELLPGAPDLCLPVAAERRERRRRPVGELHPDWGRKLHLHRHGNQCRRLRHADERSGGGQGAPAGKPAPSSIASPASGASYEQGQAVSTFFSCSEGAGGPGLASCTDSNGTKAPNGDLNTMTLGLFTYTVTAVSKDGQRTTASINYLVVARKAPPAPPPTPPPKPPRIAIASSSAQVRGRTTRLALTCSGSGSCRGVLSLTYLTSTRSHGRKRAKQVLFARTRYALASGQRRGVSLKLSPRARRLLLKARARHLTVRARTTVTGGATKQRNVVLRFR